jgi:hypothetical protein
VPSCEPTIDSTFSSNALAKKAAPAVHRLRSVRNEIIRQSRAGKLTLWICRVLGGPLKEFDPIWWNRNRPEEVFNSCSIDLEYPFGGRPSRTGNDIHWMILAPREGIDQIAARLAASEKEPSASGADVPAPVPPEAPLPATQLADPVPGTSEPVPADEPARVASTELPGHEPPPANGETAPTVPAATASQGIPFMVTNTMKAELRARGISDEQIRNMTPQQARETLNAPGSLAREPEESPLPDAQPSEPAQDTPESEAPPSEQPAPEPKPLVSPVEPAPPPVSERSVPDDEPGVLGRLDAEGPPEGAARRHPGGRPVEINWAGANAYVDRIVARYGRPLPWKKDGNPNLAPVVKLMERFLKKTEPPPWPGRPHIYRWLRDHPQEWQGWFGSS